MTPLQPTAELRALLRERADQLATVPADRDSARQHVLRIEQEELLAVMVPRCSPAAGRIVRSRSIAPEPRVCSPAAASPEG